MIQQLARLFGLVFLAFGVLAFVPGITTNYDELGWVGPDSDARLFGVFKVSALYNIDHIVYGVAGLVLARWWEAARWYLLVGAIVWGGVSIYGVVVGENSDMNFWSMNTADEILHLVLAFFLLQAWVVNKEDRDKVGFDSPLPREP